MSTLFGVSVKKVTHDCKPLMRRLLELGYPAESFIFDTALAAYDLDATQGSYDLDRVVTHLLGFEIGRADKDEVGEEAARVAIDLRRRLRSRHCMRRCRKSFAQNGMEKLYYEIELPLCRVLAEMEYAGVKADQMALISFGNMLQSRIEAASRPFSISPGANSISIPRSSSARSCLTSWDCPQARRRRAAIRQTRMFSKSSRASTRSLRRFSITVP